MRFIKNGWWGTDEDNRWFFIGTDEELFEYITELDEFEEFAKSLIRDAYEKMDSYSQDVFKGAMLLSFALHDGNGEDVYRWFVRKHIEEHNRDYPFFIDRCTGGSHRFRWTNKEEDLEWE